MLVVLMLVSSLVFAQAVNPAREYERRRNSEAPADGVWYVYDREGNLSKEEHYKTYRLDGEVKSFYKSGAIKAITPYVDGFREGLERTYFEKGGLMGENTYSRNNLNGTSHQYYDDGSLQQESNYLNGQLNGVTKIYYRNGNLKQVWNYKLGVINGTVLNYGEDGQIKSEDIYSKGEIASHKDYVNDVSTLVAGEKAPAPASKTPAAKP